MSDKTMVRLLAETLSGIQVPMSMGVIGAAAQPYAELRDRLGLFGYPNADEIEKSLKRVGVEAPE